MNAQVEYVAQAGDERSTITDKNGVARFPDALEGEMLVLQLSDKLYKSATMTVSSRGRTTIDFYPDRIVFTRRTLMGVTSSTQMMSLDASDEGESSNREPAHAAD